jgi:hypothetical protein
MLKKIISAALVIAGLAGVTGCHAHAGVGTKHHSVGVGTHAK